MLYEHIKNEYDKLLQRISSIESELETLPSGKLICCHDHTKVKWYHSDGKSKVYPYTGDFYYWEHFGMMDNPAYIQNTTTKLNQYALQGITPGIQLITTYETKSQPLDPDLVEKYIQYYFL